MDSDEFSIRPDDTFHGTTGLVEVGYPRYIYNQSGISGC